VVINKAKTEGLVEQDRQICDDARRLEGGMLRERLR